MSDSRKPETRDIFPAVHSLFSPTTAVEAVTYMPNDKKNRIMIDRTYTSCVRGRLPLPT